MILQAECAGNVASVSELRAAIDGALAALKQQLELDSTGVDAGQ